MKSTGRAFFTSACFLLFAGSFISREQSSVKAQTLTYIESSSGLASPEWEGGRTELEFADMNGDGNIDIITIGDHGNPGIQSGEEGLMVYFGDGQGHWSVQMAGDFGYGGIAAGDVNNDGLMDVGYAMHHDYSSTDFGDQLIEVALGDGTGTNWTPWDDGLATNGEDWGMFGTDFADFDNDGDLDLGSISFGCCSGIHLYKNNLDGTWTQSFGFNDGNSDMIFEFGDINNDGFMDFIVGHQSGTAYFGDGTGDFTLNDLGLPSAGSLGRYGPSLGDVDNDGGMDLAFTNSNGGVFVYTFMEDTGEWTNWSGTLPTSGNYEMTQLADMNMDGFIDLAAYGEGTFRLFPGDGNGNWTSDATFSVGDPGSCQAFRVGGDADHNGRPDIVLLEETELSWFTYQNYLHFFKENSTPPALTVQAVYPHGNELFRPGSVCFIEWVCAVPESEPASRVTRDESLAYLELSTSGPDGPWTLIAAALPDNGRYQWLVPDVNSNNCYIRHSIAVGQNTIESITPAAFTITNGSIGIRENERKQLDVYVYPNPASQQILISPSRIPAFAGTCWGRVGVGAAGSWQLASVIITDLFGRQLIEIASISTFPFLIDISVLNDGLYILKMVSEDGETASVKFLKVSD